MSTRFTSPNRYIFWPEEGVWTMKIIGRTRVGEYHPTSVNPIPCDFMQRWRKADRILPESVELSLSGSPVFDDALLAVFAEKGKDVTEQPL